MESFDLLAVWFCIIFGVLVPLMALKSARAVRRGLTLPPKRKIFRNIVIMHAVFLGISLLGARARDIEVFARGGIHAAAVCLAAGMLAVALCLMPLVWKITRPDVRSRLLVSRPERTSDLSWWFLVSLTAGVVEEIAYRGVLVSLLLPMTSEWTGHPQANWPITLAGDFGAGWWLAVAISVAAFVLGHWGQDWPRTIFLAVFSVGSHVLVRMTGSLYLSMSLHFLYDFIAGAISIRLVRRLRPAPAA